MGRTSDWLKYQDRRRRNSRRLSKNRHSVYARKYYWVMKLRRLGVPEIDIPDAVRGIMQSRCEQLYAMVHPECRHRCWHSWYARNKKRLRGKTARYSEKMKNEDMSRRDFLLRAKGG